MNIATKSLIAGFALIAASVGRAQSTTTTPPSGVLGQRLVEAGVGITQERAFSTPWLNASLGVNLPVWRHLDLSLGYGYSHLSASYGPNDIFDMKGTSQMWNAGATGYLQVGHVKPFLAANLATLWTKQSIAYSGYTVVETDDVQAAWKVTLGAEIPCAKVTITPYVSYTDRVNREDPRYYYYYESTDALVCGLDAHYWINRSLGAFAKVSRFEPLANSAFTWTYTLGARYRF